MAFAPGNRPDSDRPAGVQCALRPVPLALRPASGAMVEPALPCALLATPTVARPPEPVPASSPLAALQAFWGAPAHDRRRSVRARLADIAGSEGEVAATVQPPAPPPVPAPSPVPSEPHAEEPPPKQSPPAATDRQPAPTVTAAADGRERVWSTRVVRNRPVPASTPQADADGGELRIVTGPAVRAALAEAGAEAASVGTTVLLAEEPDGSPRSLGILAHELVHAAENGEAPRFLGGELDGEEERARRIGAAVEQAAGEGQALSRGDVQQLTAALGRLTDAPVHASSTDHAEQMAALVDALGDRVLDELDRRGGRFLGLLP